MQLPADVSMPFLLMRAFRSLVDEVHAELNRQGFPDVRAHHGFTLQAIGSGCTSVELGHRLGVSKQAATKSARALENLGLVERSRNQDDQRELILSITHRGHRLLELSGRAFAQKVADWRSQVGDADVDATLTTLLAVSHDGRPDTDISDWF